MDSKIVTRLFLLIVIFFPTNLIAIEFKGKFLQGHYIVGITDPSSQIIIDKKKVRVSKDGYFVFGIDRDRKFDLTITKITNGKSEKVIKKILKREDRIKLYQNTINFIHPRVELDLASFKEDIWAH